MLDTDTKLFGESTKKPTLTIKTSPYLPSGVAESMPACWQSNRILFSYPCIYYYYLYLFYYYYMYNMGVGRDRWYKQSIPTNSVCKLDHSDWPFVVLFIYKIINRDLYIIEEIPVTLTPKLSGSSHQKNKPRSVIVRNSDLIKQVWLYYCILLFYNRNFCVQNPRTIEWIN